MLARDRRQQLRNLAQAKRGFNNQYLTASELLDLLEAYAPELWPVPVYRCRVCGCLWRDNLDDTVSLWKNARSCAVCEQSDVRKVCEVIFLNVRLLEPEHDTLKTSPPPQPTLTKLELLQTITTQYDTQQRAHVNAARAEKREPVSYCVCFSCEALMRTIVYLGGTPHAVDL